MATATLSTTSSAYYACRTKRPPPSQTAYAGRRKASAAAAARDEQNVSFQTFLEQRFAVPPPREPLADEHILDEKHQHGGRAGCYSVHSASTQRLVDNTSSPAGTGGSSALADRRQVQRQNDRTARRRKKKTSKVQDSRIAAWIVLVYRWVLWLIARYYPIAEKDTAENADSEDEDVMRTRYTPESIDSLVCKTKFSTIEIRYMYRGFKNDCPSGVVDRDTFKDIYCSFFPQGDASSYADLVFMSLDQAGTDELTFEQFVIGLSKMARGTQREKLEWIYVLYDSEQRGYITRADFVAVARAMFTMMGLNVVPAVDRADAMAQASAAFDRMDMNGNGLVSKSEFIAACTQSENIMNSLFTLDTLIKTS